MLKHKIICGKSETELKQFEDNTFDSCVCDPPYGLEFMGKDWDKFGGKPIDRSDINPAMGIHRYFKGNKPVYNWDLHKYQEFCYEWATELYRVMKPGAHILVFGGTRTYHRMACAVEDSGFECRDMISWNYGSGFPKSLDISKAFDKMNSKERERFENPLKNKQTSQNKTMALNAKKGTEQITPIPISEEAIQWNGWGTGLKPAHEPILLARKPISERNIASNVLKGGVGGLNIESCRIGLNGGTKSKGKGVESEICYGNGLNKTGVESINKGRFPANLILDEEAGRMLDEQSGELKSGDLLTGHKRGSGISSYDGGGGIIKSNYGGDKGGASRFFYQAKASQKERWFYCTICKQAYQMKERDKHTHNAPEETKYQYLEFHPTQKPEALIRYLARLITPPNGTMLDPFLGSGTGLIAAEREGFNCTGIDSKREYCQISSARLKNEIEREQTKLTGKLSEITCTGL